MGDSLDNIKNETYNGHEPKNLCINGIHDGSESRGEDWLASKPLVAKTKNNTKNAGGLLIYHFLKATGQI